MKVSGAQVKAARDLLKITQAELAEATGIAERTVRKFEGDGILEPGNLEKLLAELERRGIEFTNGTGIGVRLHFEKAAEFARSAASARNQSAR
jgi:transcriptional regulator with XRE-family HTH domain